MSDWARQIPRCFDPQDLVFADTAAQRASAEQLRADIRSEGISPMLIEAAIEEWLHGECSNTGQIWEQMARVRSFFEQ